MSKKGLHSAPSLDITERRQMEEYKTIIETAIDGFWLIDMQGRFLDVNDAYCELIGYSRDELLKMSIPDVEAIEKPEETAARITKIMKVGRDRFESRHRCKDGRIIDVEVSVNYIDVRGGRMFVFIRDITERKEVEEALRRSEQRFRDVSESALEWIWEVDTNGKYTYSSPLVEKVLGYKPEEMLKKHFYDLFHPEDRQQLKQAAFEVFARKEPFHEFVNRNVCENGEVVWFSTSGVPILDEKGDLVGYRGADTDITERKKAEEALTNEATRRRILIEQSRDGIVVLDQDGNVFEANQRFTEMLGYSREEMFQLNVWDWEFQFPPEQVLKMIRTVDETGDHFETQHRRKDGTIYNVEISTNAAVFTGQKLIFCVCRDITERKRMERELQEKNEQLDAQNKELRATEEELRSAKEKLEERVKERTAELETANEELRAAQEQLVRSERLAAIGQLAGGVGHELRNPLGAIKNAVYYVRGKVAKSELGQTEPRVTEFLNIIDDEINSSNKIINDLLNFSRVGKPAVSPARIEVVIDDAVAHTSIPENIELTKKLDAGLPEVEIDADQIRQVLVNIVTNAVQAMSEGGKLTLAASQEDKFLKVKVTDTGYGVPKEIIGKIFDPLFTTKAKGIGLGLAVCKSIIDRHRGRIEVESEVGKGTTFTIKLPLKAE